MKLTTPYTLGIYFPVNDKELEDFKGYFATKFLGQNFPPHLSVLALPIPEDKIVIAREIVKEAVSSIFAFSISCEDLKVDQGSNFTSIMISPEIVTKHHNFLLEELGKLRDGYIREKDNAIAENEFVSKYGFKYSGENFVSHFTLGKIPEDMIDEIPDLQKRFLDLKGRVIPINTVNFGIFLDRDSEKRSIWEDSIRLSE